MPFVRIAGDDPRAQVCAYVTDGRGLFEITDDQRGVLVLENCQTGCHQTISRSNIASYKLIKAAPAAPDTPPEGDS